MDITSVVKKQTGKKLQKWQYLQVSIGHAFDTVGGTSLAAKPAPKVTQHVGPTQSEANGHQHQPLEPESKQSSEEKDDLQINEGQIILSYSKFVVVTTVRQGIERDRTTRTTWYRYINLILSFNFEAVSLSG